MAISGGGRSSHHDEEEFGPSVFSDINITPLTDIFLVLLIIFMVGSSIVVEQAQGGGTGVRVDLPKGAAKELQVQARDFPVAVLKDGTVVAEGKETREFDGRPYVRVVEVMEVAKVVGVQRLAIATEAQP